MAEAAVRSRPKYNWVKTYPRYHIMLIPQSQRKGSDMKTLLEGYVFHFYITVSAVQNDSEESVLSRIGITLTKTIEMAY